MNLLTKATFSFHILWIINDDTEFIFLLAS